MGTSYWFVLWRKKRYDPLLWDKWRGETFTGHTSTVSYFALLNEFWNALVGGWVAEVGCWADILVFHLKYWSEYWSSTWPPTQTYQLASTGFVKICTIMWWTVSRQSFCFLCIWEGVQKTRSKIGSIEGGTNWRAMIIWKFMNPNLCGWLQDFPGMSYTRPSWTREQWHRHKFHWNVKPRKVSAQACRRSRRCNTCRTAPGLQPAQDC